MRTCPNEETISQMCSIPLTMGPLGNGKPLDVHGCTQFANAAMASEIWTCWEIVLAVMAPDRTPKRLQGWTLMHWN